MSDITPLDDILNEPEVEAETKAEAITDPPSGIADAPSRLRDEHGRFAKKDEAGEPDKAISGTPPQEQEPGRVPVAALQDERQKRQQLEAQLEQALGLLNQRQAQQPQQPPPDMFDDPDGFKAHFREQLKAELLQELGPTMQHQGVMTRAEVSEMLARQKYEDYDQTVESFKEAMQANPFLLTQLQQAPDPATFAYNAGKQFAEAKAYGGALPSRDQLKAELLEEVKAELGLANRPSVPSTLADSRSVASRSGPAWTGPTPLGDILSR